MKFILLLLLMSFTSWAQAQWLNLAYTYSDLTYKEGTTTTQKGRLAGVKGELGLPLLAGISASAGGEYQSGNFNYDGTTVDGAAFQGLTKDYIGDLQFLLHMHYGGLTISGGIGQRYWYDDLVTSYRRRTSYDYTPVLITFRRKGVYFRGEADLWRSGKATYYMGDLGGGRGDTDFKMSAGSGFGGEIGYLVPNALGFATHVFVGYKKWSVKASDSQYTGAEFVVIPENNISLYQVGIGISF